LERRLKETAMRNALAALAMLPMLGAAASAEEAERYRLEKSETGYVRMDTRTGAMSICEERSGQLVCKLAADERAAFEDETDRLRDRIEALDARVTKLEGSLAARLENSLPTEEEIERSLSYMERFLKSFMGAVKDLDKEPRDTRPDEAVPQKTAN
jgi:hypothetical protein